MSLMIPIEHPADGMAAFDIVGIIMSSPVNQHKRRRDEAFWTRCDATSSLMKRVGAMALCIGPGDASLRNNGIKSCIQVVSIQTQM